MQELFVGKIHFFRFLSTSDKPRLYQLKVVPPTRSAYIRTVQASLTVWIFPSAWGYTIKEEEIPYAENKHKASPTYQAH